MSEKTKQKKQETTNVQSSQNDGWCVVSQKKQNDKENSVLTASIKEVAGSSLTNKNVAALNKISKSSNTNQDSISTQDDKGSEKQGDGLTTEKKKMSENSINTNQSNQINDTSSVHNKSDDNINQMQITPTDKFNQFRERLNEQTKRYYYFDKQFFKIYNCQQINGLDSNLILKLEDENSTIYQDLRNIILSYINYNGGIIFFGFNHIKRDNSPHMEVNGFDITKNDKRKYKQLQDALDKIFQRITPKQYKYDLSIMKVRKDKNQDRFTQEKYVARIIVQQGSELRTLYVYKDPKSQEQITAKYSKKDQKFITIKGTGLTQAQEQKKQLTKVKDLIYTHIDDFEDPQSSYVNIRKTKSQNDPKKNDQDGDQSFNDSKSRYDDDNSQDNDDDVKDNSKSNFSEHSFDSEPPSQSKGGWDASSKDQPTQNRTTTKDPQIKYQDSNQNKENQESETVNIDVGQWDTELIPDKSFSQKGKNKSDSNNFLQNQQDEEAFPNINLFGKNSSSQIDQADSQSNSSITQQDQSLQNSNGARAQQQEQQNIYYTMAGNFQQNNPAPSSTSSKRVIEQKVQDNQTILRVGTPNSQIQQNYQNSIMIPMNNQMQNQQQNFNQNNILKSPELIQKTYSYQQQPVIMTAGNQPYTLMPQTYSYPPSQSSTPIPYQPSPQITVSNSDCTLSSSLKNLNDQQLQELINHLEIQTKNYQDYLNIAKFEDQKRKYESLLQLQFMNQNALNMHIYGPTQNGSAFSNPHSNSSLAN